VGDMPPMFKNMGFQPEPKHLDGGNLMNFSRGSKKHGVRKVFKVYAIHPTAKARRFSVQGPI